MESPGRLSDLIPNSLAVGGWTRVLPAIRSSTARVTRCSTFSALTPGHGVLATARRMGMCGSLRLGMCAYP